MSRDVSKFKLDCGTQYIGKNPVFVNQKDPLTGMSMGWAKIEKGIPWKRLATDTSKDS